jgi:hypothetical protein
MDMNQSSCNMLKSVAGNAENQCPQASTLQTLYSWEKLEMLLWLNARADSLLLKEPNTNELNIQIQKWTSDFFSRLIKEYEQVLIRDILIGQNDRDYDQQ